MELLLIYRPRRDGRLSWPSWLTHSGRLTDEVVTRQPWTQAPLCAYLNTLYTYFLVHCKLYTGDTTEHRVHANTWCTKVYTEETALYKN